MRHGVRASSSRARHVPAARLKRVAAATLRDEVGTSRQQLRTPRARPQRRGSAATRPPAHTPLVLPVRLVPTHPRLCVRVRVCVCARGGACSMDEYVGLTKDHPQSYHHFMWSNFFSKVNIKPENANILDGNAPDLQAECDRYEAKIAALGGIELFMAGIGPDGHIAFSTLCTRARACVWSPHPW
ncbi:hypothetical protein EON67_00050 [archaeon]|nr:MAG: hypothetical protein EON67_00050 [archaeon]